VIYYVARKWFGFSREWSVPLASGISICGVAGGDRTPAVRSGQGGGADPGVVAGGGVRVIEILILPFLAQTFLWQEPLVGRAGSVLRSRPTARRSRARHHRIADHGEGRGEGIRYQPGWILATTTTVKSSSTSSSNLGVHPRLHLDQSHRQGTGSRKPSEIWQRFRIHPRLHLRVRSVAVARGGIDAGNRKGAAGGGGRGHCFRVIFFILTFFSIGVLSNFRRLVATGLWQTGGGLFRQPVRICDLGRSSHLLAVLQRLQAAAGKLSSRKENDVSTRPQE